MPEVNIHTGDAFEMETLTAAINSEPYAPGQISATGIFEEDGVATTTISVEMRNGQLALVEPTPRGGPGDTTGDEEREKVSFDITHYERNDSVLADEVQNVRAFGSEDTMEVLTNRINRKLFRHGRDLTMTLEHQRVGAVKGIVLSKSGKTLVNLYSKFGIAVPADVEVDLDDETTDISEIWQDTMYDIEDSLDEAGAPLQHHVFTGREFHRKLWRHKMVRDTFLNTAEAGVLRQDVPDVFQWNNATWERYRTGRRATADQGSPYIADDEARTVIKGIPELFITRFGPADYNETVNTIGLPFYSKAIPKRNDKGTDLEIQMNAISLCTRPQILRKLKIG